MVGSIVLRGMYILAAATTMFPSCSSDDDEIVTPRAKNYFTLWNSGEALTALQQYVQDVTDPNPASANYIREEDRTAASSDPELSTINLYTLLRTD